ncbi:N-acetylmuramoyl-L-alanine amidase [Mycobacterium shimoidei]|uniref:N-acetylmuramoyl-L-alanine amidase n=1 Tax=Mycobacterium shimoidei TaxID=29313 RepID=UPI000AB7EF67|nr:N-acetylmuramoyl-L-alanine amidase [Mycobacterium shimoidei]
MDAPGPERPDHCPDCVNRRQLLRLAGSVGLASMVSACSTATTPRTDRVSASPVGLTTRPAAPVTPHPLAPSTGSPLLLCRDAWGARPARPGGRRHTITRLTLHHEAVVLGENRNAPGRLRQDQRYHQDQLGWIDIAYHVGVDRDGNIYELRSTELAGDTATDYDTTGHFLVLCEGDFDQETVSEAQLHSTAAAFAWAAQTFGVTSATLAGHRDLARTSCPGANLYAHLASGDLKRRIDGLLAAGRVDLQRYCGPDAAARVAAIENGGP